MSALIAAFTRPAAHVSEPPVKEPPQPRRHQPIEEPPKRPEDDPSTPEPRPPPLPPPGGPLHPTAWRSLGLAALSLSMMLFGCEQRPDDLLSVNRHHAL